MKDKKWGGYYKSSLWHKLINLAILQGSGGGEQWSTVTGAIASFITQRSAPLRSLVCAINPVQDLHGYDSPWPPGGGINSMPNCVSYDQTSYGVRCVTDGNGVYTLSGTANGGNPAFIIALSESFTIPTSDTHKVMFMNSQSNNAVGFCFMNGNTQIDSWTMNPGNRIHSSYQVMGGKTCDGVRITINEGTLVNMTISPMFVLHSISDDTPFTSYSNICPISGHTGAEVVRTGKNLLPNTPGRNSNGGLDFSVDSVTKKLVINGTNTSTAYTGGGITKANARYSLKAGTYTLSVDRLPTNTNGSYLDFEMFTADGTRTQKLIYGHHTNKYTTFTIASDVVFDWWVAIAAGTYNDFQCGIQLELGSTASSYEPYTGTTYPITFGALGKNLFGGSFNTMFALSLASGTVITVSGDLNGATYGVLRTYDSEQTFLQSITFSSGSPRAFATLTLSSDASYVKIEASGGTPKDIQIELGDSATSYEPYNDTVYGGTLDVVTGVLTALYAKTTIAELEWTKDSTYQRFQSVGLTTTIKKASANNKPLEGLLCSAFATSAATKTGSAWENNKIAVSNNGTIFISNDTYSTKEAFVTAYGSETIVYPLAEPITYQLTPTQVTALLGQNNVWHDGNGDTTVEYLSN